MSKLLLAANTLREIWDKYDDTNIYGHLHWEYGTVHEMPEWRKFINWPNLRKMLRHSCAEHKKPFVYYEEFSASPTAAKILHLPRNKKNFSMASSLLLVAQNRTSRWGRQTAPLEVVKLTTRLSFYFAGEAGDELWNEWLNNYLNNEEWRFQAGLPKRVSNRG